MSHLDEVGVIKLSLFIKLEYPLPKDAFIITFAKRSGPILEQTLKYFSIGCFVPSLDETDPLVLKKKIVK